MSLENHKHLLAYIKKMDKTSPGEGLKALDIILEKKLIKKSIYNKLKKELNMNQLTNLTTTNGNTTLTLEANYNHAMNTNCITTGTFTCYQPLITTYYPNYLSYWSNENTISKAFKLVQKLIDLKVIKEPKTIKKFIELVNQISEVI